MDSIHLLFAGDFVPPDNQNEIFSEDLREVLKDKDYSIVNLESPLILSANQIQKTGNNFKSHPDCVKHINDGAFDAVALSNNHIRDFGKEGVLNTIKICKENKIETIGAGANILEAAKPLILNIKKNKIAILNYSEREFNIASNKQAGANPFDLVTAFYQINELKKENEFVFVIYHGGLEYNYYPTPGIVKNFKYLIDVGADCVVSHHTHRYSGNIIYKNKPILFGLGNFLSSTKTKVNNEWLIGIIAKIIIKDKSIDLELIPTKMSNDQRKVDVLKGIDKEKVLNHINSLTSVIEDALKIEDYWENVFSLETRKMLNLLKSDSHFEFRMRKYFLKFIPPRISNYKLRTLLNLIRCEAHREKLIEIFESIYQTSQNVDRNK